MDADPPDRSPEPPIPVAGAAETIVVGPTEASGRGARKAGLAFIFAASLMDIMAIGIIIPVLPQLVRSFTHGDTARAAQYVGLFGLVFAAMQLVFSPVLGALSDRFGRRPVLLTSIFGLGANYVLMALAPSLGWLLLGRMISGVTSASFSTANAYIADVTPPEKRAASFGLLGAAFGVGFVLGPVIGGVLGKFGTRLPFWGAAGLAAINGLYGLFVLPESLPRDRRAPFTLRNANPLSSLRLYAESRQLTALASVLFLYYFAHQVLQSIFVLYTALRYGWDSLMVSLALAASGLGNIVVQGAVVRPFVSRFGERGALVTGLTGGAVGFVIYATAAQGWGYWLGVPFFAMVGLVQPGVQGMMTRRVSSTSQGRLQGANSGVMALAGLIGPVFFTQVFAWSIRPAAGIHLPGLALYVAAGSLLAALAVTAAQPRAPRGIAAAA